MTEPQPAGLQIAYEFTTSAVYGLIRPAGHMHGLVLTHDRLGRTITRPGGCLLNLEHYTTPGRCGLFVPRDEAAQSHHLQPNGLQIDFAATPDWPVEASVEYALLAQDTFEARFAFHFLKDFSDFEAFIASYLPAATEPPWIKMDGRWQRPTVDPQTREQVFVPRDESARRIVSDGRWDVLIERGHAYRATAEGYTLPMQVSVLAGDEGSSQLPARPVLIQMAERRSCLALSPNRFAPAHDFSLLGETVRAGETRHARIRLLYRVLASLADAEALYLEFDPPADSQ